MRASASIAIVATALLCVLGAPRVKGDDPSTCGLLRPDGELALCAPKADCILFMDVPLCTGSNGKYLKGPVGGTCYLVGNPYPPEIDAWDTKECSYECSVQGKTKVCK
ncbi:hypothetical protein BCV69DRAFT_283703 [Microstroma glucosiphilum]|uniref:Secreted protein n=1 Tax=Pseudomicrostroma glucosiphilum TaxID=1684307 RepID=A0A316U732_9BASI|nr:hypothetical protein BCV69DRAFT_283703 [Pseudomicrostroma glucosiphilum]PWN20163.1 hypothetical protein BCV69DRAFT_283703 [Pseudomicrostroma glucosiphilum]